MKFSVIVPTYNRISSLQKTLESLLSLNYSDHEIIVVNDGSDDGTAEFLADMTRRHSIQVVTQQRRGPAAARNAGIRAARGKWIAFTDDDCTVPGEWLNAFEQAFEESGAALVGGSARCAGRQGLPARTTHEMISFFVGYLADRQRFDFLTSNNIAYDAARLRSAGMFDERFRQAGGEERVLNRAILRDGGSGAYLGDLTVDHYQQMNLAGFFRKHFAYGRGAAEVRRRAGSASSLPLSAHAALCTHWLRSNPVSGLARCACYALAQLATAGGFAAASVRRAA